MVCALIFLVMGMITMFFPQLFLDGDTWWHLAAGRYMVEHQSIPTTDPFSYTFKGQPWVAHEWLSELLMYGSFSVLGWSGLAALFGVSFAAVVTLICHYAQRWMTPISAAGLAVLVSYCFLPRLFARPHVFAWLVLTVWMIVLLYARERKRAPHLGWGLLMVVWANLHGSYPIGIVIAAAFGLEALLEAPANRRWDVIRSWGLFGAVILLAAMMTPSGPEGLYFPFMVSSMESLRAVGEWKPTDFEAISFFSLALYFMVFFCLYRPVQLPLVRALLVVLLLHMALSHVRHQEVFAIVTGLILAEPLGRAYRPGADLPEPTLASRLASGWRSYLPLLGVIAVMIVVPIAVRLAAPIVREDSSVSPGKALANLPRGLSQKRVFNGYGFSGRLIFERIPVFIDGRVDMYGDRFAQDFFDIEVHRDFEKWRAADQKWHFCWTILGSSRSIAHWLDKQQDWKRIYADEWAVVHVRQNDARCR